MFMDALEKWVRSAREDDFGRARQYAEDLLRGGELMVIHPEFRRCFRQRYPDTDPRDALLHLCQFMVCATEGRARVLSMWLDEHGPVDARGDATDL
jgi:hypothetical protein